MSERQSDDRHPLPAPRSPADPVEGSVMALRLLAARDRAEARRDRGRAAADRRRAADYLTRAYRDGLTGALQRDAGQAQLQREVARTHAHRGVLTIAFLDVVGLKQINDSEGHAEGDAVLVAVGTALADRLRSCDLVVRWGGDEFVCAMPTTSAEGARRRMEEVRDRLHLLHPLADFTIGVATLRRDETLESCVARADQALYAVRRSGDGVSG